MKVPVWLRAVSFLIIAPGSILGLFPWWVTDGHLEAGGESAAFLAVAVVLFAVGLSTLLWCFVDFGRRGLGTPAPYDPPKKLVVAGLYRYTRNPMYVALVLALVGESIWSQSRGMMIYTAVVAVGFHLRVVIHEEPKLTELFGDEFADYRRRVPRWLPLSASRAE